VTKVISRAKSLGQRLRNRLFGYLPNKRGNVAAIIAISMVPLSGVMGMAWEGANWFLNQRAQQNGADAAVVAAANQALQDYYLSCAGTTNSCTPTWSSTNYQTEGLSVANNYGYTSGTNNVTVNVINTVGCPGNVTVTGFKCFQVTISKPQPLYLTRLLGFGGNSTFGGQRMELISASAIAGPVAEPSNICLLTLGSGPYTKNSTKEAFDFHGSNGINLAACPVGSNNGMNCTGANLNAPFGIAGNGGTDSNCGNLTLSQPGPIADPLAALAADIPLNTCGGSYGTVSSGTLSTTAGGPTGAATIIVCGNLQLSADFKVTGDETIVVENGVLDLNGHNFCTGDCLGGGTGGVTVIFTSPSYSQIPASVIAGTTVNGAQGYIQDSVGGGGLNIQAPPKGSGDFQGVTLYQDPTPWAGSPPNTYPSIWNGNSSKTGWDLSGGVYMPNANYIFNGAIDKASNGYQCFDMVTNSITSNGGNQYSLFATGLANPLSQCGGYGTPIPHAYGYRFALVG
jgi:Flp pilus assembly protein TadG